MTIDALAANRQRQEMRLYRANAIREFTSGGEAIKSVKETPKLPPTPEEQLAAQRVEKIAKARVAAINHGVMPMKQPEDEYKEEMAHRIDAQNRARGFLNDSTGGALDGAVVPGNPLGPEPVRRQDGSVHPQSDQIKQVIRENRRAWNHATQPLQLPSFDEWRLARGI